MCESDGITHVVIVNAEKELFSFEKRKRKTKFTLFSFKLQVF